MNHHERAPQPAPEELSRKKALQLQQELSANPYRFSAFKDYLENVDAGYVTDLKTLMNDHQAIATETCKVLIKNFQSFEAQTDSKSDSQTHTIMGRRVSPHVAQTMEDGWQTALTEWNNRHSK